MTDPFDGEQSYSEARNDILEEAAEHISELSMDYEQSGNLIYAEAFSVAASAIRSLKGE